MLFNRALHALCLISAAFLFMGASPPRPRLVTLIIIDQFRHDYLNRFGDLFVENGFRRLMNRGAWMTDATYSHLHTTTSPGHAVITSGTYGYRTGMIANSWYDRKLGRERRSLADADHHILGMKPDPNGRSSTREIEGSTLADELRMATRRQGKVIAISSKDYSAMISAGKLGTPYWYEARIGQITSSSFFMKDLPDWVRRFNDRKIPDASFGRTWSRLLSEDVYLQRAGRDDAPGEEDNRKSGVVFPHILTGGLTRPGPEFYQAFKHTPWANDLELEFARQAIIEEKLGQDDIPDILIISLSANDYVGHDYGPDSQEVMDITLRTDQQLADFFTFLDENVGADQTMIVLTADHGATPMPEQTALLGMPAGRVAPDSILHKIETRLDARYGADDWTLFLGETGLYLNQETITKHHLRPEDVEQTAAAVLSAEPSIASAIPRSRIVSGQTPETGLSRAVFHSFHPEKSGDVIPVAEPFYLLFGEYGEASFGSSHGQPYDYDTHVPILFYGPWIEPGIYRHPVDIADITPTICNLLGVTMPTGRDGRVLAEIIR